MWAGRYQGSYLVPGMNVLLYKEMVMQSGVRPHFLRCYGAPLISTPTLLQVGLDWAASVRQGEQGSPASGRTEVGAGRGECSGLHVLLNLGLLLKPQCSESTQMQQDACLRGKALAVGCCTLLVCPAFAPRTVAPARTLDKPSVPGWRRSPTTGSCSWEPPMALVTAPALRPWDAHQPPAMPGLCGTPVPPESLTLS